MSDQFVGEIRVFGFNFAPQGWALCNGQLLQISQNTALFSLLGTNYGGDGVSTFGLPDLQGSFALCQGEGPGLTERVVGDSGGEAAVTLDDAELPAHTHTVSPQSSDDWFTSELPTGMYPAQGGVYARTADSPQPLGASVTPAAAAVAHNNLQPYLVLNFVIALVGIYPARS